MIVGQDKPSLDELAHFGVKGMRWGVRRDDKGGVTVGSRHFDKKQVRKAAIIFGSAVGVAAIAAGGAYAAHRFGASELGSTKISDLPKPSPSVVKFVDSMAKEPVGIVHAARGKNYGFTFPGRGGLEKPMTEYLKSGLAGTGGGGGGVPPGYFARYGDRMEKVAANFKDPLGRKDFAGRDISHDVMLPESLAKGVNSAEEAAAVAWPLIKDKYDALYEAAKDAKF